MLMSLSSDTPKTADCLQRISWKRGFQVRGWTNVGCGPLTSASFPNLSTLGAIVLDETSYMVTSDRVTALELLGTAFELYAV